MGNMDADKYMKNLEDIIQRIELLELKVDLLVNLLRDDFEEIKTPELKNLKNPE